VGRFWDIVYKGDLIIPHYYYHSVFWRSWLSDRKSIRHVWNLPRLSAKIFIGDPTKMCMAWWCNGYGAGLATPVWSPAFPLLGNNLRQVVHIHAHPSPCSINDTGQRSVIPCGCEGNRRSGVVPAVRHRLKWFIYLQDQWPSKEDEHLPTICQGLGRLDFSFTFNRPSEA